jgi:hypothetical protein
LGILNTYDLKIHHAVKMALEKDAHTPFYWKLNGMTERVNDYVYLFNNADKDKGRKNFRRKVYFFWFLTDHSKHFESKNMNFKK